MKFRNLILAIADQGPPLRFIKNLWKGHFWGLLHKNSCIRQDTGKPKVAYGSKKSAKKSAEAMSKKRGVYFSNYKCVFCDGFHIGKNTHANNFDNVTLPPKDT